MNPVPAEVPGEKPPVEETERQRLDRNFNELLQELRVVQTGVQILLAFMLTVPFAAGFGRLSETQKEVYGVALVLVGAATACLIGPVAVHRLTFRRQLKPQVVVVAHWMVLVGLALLMLAVVFAVGVAATAALSDTIAVVITSVVAVSLAVCGVVVPVLLRHSQSVGP